MRSNVVRFLLLTSSMAMALTLGMLDARASARIVMRQFTSTSGCLTCPISGVVSSVKSSTEFVYSTWGVHGVVTVINSSGLVTPRGAAVKVGETVRVYGTFNGLGQLQATSVTVFTYNHIATMAEDDYVGEASGVSAANVNRLTSYVETAGKGLADCHSISLGCKAVFYMRPFATQDYVPSTCKIHPDSDILAAASESWFVHNTGYNDSAHRVYGIDQYGCLIWGMNPNSTALQTWWKNYLRKNANSYDLFFVDMSPMDLGNATWYTSGGGCQPWPHVCASTQEMANDAAVESGHINFITSLTYSNGSPMLFLYQQAYPRFTMALDPSAIASTPRYFGLTCEGCLADIPPAPVIDPSNYAPFMDEIAEINKTAGEFVILSKGANPAGSASQLLQRQVTIGFTWLVYSEGHTIVQPDLERNTHNLAIWPEDLIYPDGPVESMVSGHTDLQVSPGVYRREFDHCYYNNQTLGVCAAIVNANSTSVSIKASWLRQTYHHVLTFNGGDVLSGGTVNLTGSSFVSGVTTIQSGGAILLGP